MNEEVLTNVRDMEGLTIAILNANREGRKFIQVYNIKKEIMPFLTSKGYNVTYDEHSGIMTIKFFTNKPFKLTTGVYLKNDDIY